jgi:hypothetical protein
MTNRNSPDVTSPDTIWAWALDELAAFGHQWRQLQKPEAGSSPPAEGETCRDEDAINTDKLDTEEKPSNKVRHKLP